MKQKKRETIQHHHHHHTRSCLVISKTFLIENQSYGFVFQQYIIRTERITFLCDLMDGSSCHHLETFSKKKGVFLTRFLKTKKRQQRESFKPTANQIIRFPFFRDPSFLLSDLIGSWLERFLFFWVAAVLLHRFDCIFRFIAPSRAQSYPPTRTFAKGQTGSNEEEGA
jgi:hypothetical protein